MICAVVRMLYWSVGDTGDDTMRYIHRTSLDGDAAAVDNVQRFVDVGDDGATAAAAAAATARDIVVDVRTRRSARPR